MDKKDYIQDLTERYGSNLLTKKQAAQELQVSCTQIDRLRANGTIQSIKVGGLVRVPADVLADLMTI